MRCNVMVKVNLVERWNSDSDGSMPLKLVIVPEGDYREYHLEMTLPSAVQLVKTLLSTIRKNFKTDNIAA